MPTTLRIRDVPEDLKRRLKSRAAAAGLSLSDYLLAELREVAAQPTPEEMRARLAARSPAALLEAPADAVRAEREGR